jgi:hypothetical protein
MSARFFVFAFLLATTAFAAPRSNPTFGTRVGTGVATAAVAQIFRAGYTGELTWDYISSGRFWRPVAGSVLGASVGALVPGGNLIKAFGAIAGAALGANVLSPDRQDWTENIVTTIASAALGAVMSPVPGGAFVGAMLGHYLGLVAVTAYRDIFLASPRMTPPLFGGDPAHRAASTSPAAASHRDSADPFDQLKYR